MLGLCGFPIGFLLRLFSFRSRYMRLAGFYFRLAGIYFHFPLTWLDSSFPFSLACRFIYLPRYSLKKVQIHFLLPSQFLNIISRQIGFENCLNCDSCSLSFPQNYFSTNPIGKSSYPQFFVSKNSSITFEEKFGLRIYPERRPDVISATSPFPSTVVVNCKFT